MNDRTSWHITFIFKCLHQIFGKGILVVNNDSPESERPWLPIGTTGTGRGWMRVESVVVKDSLGVELSGEAPS